jgi:hypothetical protein
MKVAFALFIAMEVAVKRAGIFNRETNLIEFSTFIAMRHHINLEKFSLN